MVEHHDGHDSEHGALDAPELQGREHELHRAAGEHAGHAAEHDHSAHATHADVYERRFWITLILAIPVVVYSEMVQDWFGYTAPEFPGDGWVAPVLGTVTYLYGGSVFLTGAWSEIRRRSPGMMLLVALAITVAFVASAASTLGLFDLEFWWELSALVVIMLLGHWQEMKALGQARGAVSALAELLPDEAERVGDGTVERIPLGELRVGDVVLVRPGVACPPTARSSPVAPRSTSRWSRASRSPCPGAGATTSPPAPSRPTLRSASA